MPDTPDDARFADGFLEDFFAESEEHLTAIRRNLLALEAAVARGSAPADILAEMFRSFHSLKGISGMVQLEKAELLAHDMESYLRALRQGEVKLTADGLEALIDGTRLLDQIIAARRLQQAGPEIDPIRKRLAAIIGRLPRQHPAATKPAATSTLPDAETPAPSSPDLPAGAWRVTFAPSNELLARGVNVNAIRERLRGIGEIVNARPKLVGSGGIAFEFIVSAPSGPGAFEAMREDGVSYERVTPEEPPADSDQPTGRPEGQEAAVPHSTPSRVVRVDLSRLDDVMSIVADIVVARSRLDEALEAVEDRLPHGDWRLLQDANQTIERQVRLLREAIMRVRLVRVGEIFGKMPFVVRDLARDSQKHVRLDLRGQDTEIDKFIIERMMDPIIHLVRNAISHGIEPLEQRLARGKPPIGTVSLRATTIGDWIAIEVEDDGRGIDPAVVRARAKQAGFEVPADLDSPALLDLLCAAGFSTRDVADRASGRGVGMAVVKQAVEELSGTIELDSQPGRGTRFCMTLPVTLAIIDAFICRVAGRRFALPQTAVREVLYVNVADTRVLERNEIFRYRDSVLPLVRVADLLRLDRTDGAERLHVCVVGSGAQAVGLGVDRILGQREIVVRAITDPLMRIEGLAGATELGDGQPVLILDPLALVRLARRGEKGSALKARDSGLRA